MRVTRENATHPDAAFRYLRLELRGFGGPRHRHDEVELTWVVRGRGVRCVGDSAEPFDYPTRSHFNRAFAARFHQTPSRYWRG